MGECGVACVLKKDASYQRSFKFKRLQALGFLSCLITAMFSPTFSSVFLSYFISVRFVSYNVSYIFIIFTGIIELANLSNLHY